MSALLFSTAGTMLLAGLFSEQILGLINRRDT